MNARNDARRPRRSDSLVARTAALVRGPTARWGLLSGVVMVLLLSGAVPASGLNVPPGLAAPSVGVGTASHGAASSTGAAVTASQPTLTPPSFALAASHPAASPVPSSGPGTFFTTQAQPLPGPGNQSCSSSYYCYNDTSEPSLNLTTRGLLAVAYTAYTRNAPCPGMVNISTGTEIGFSVSKNLGSTWSAPVYLGNPVCKGFDANFSNAANPSLTSLANGTLVLSYVEYNWSFTWCTYCYVPVAPDFSYYNVLYDRVVVSESYNNGTNWTIPTVVDTTNSRSASSYGPYGGFPDLRPWVTAYGSTVYVAWENVTNGIPYGVCGGSIDITLRSSTNGGANWSANTTLAPVEGSAMYCYPSATHVAMNPMIITNPSGTLFLAYLTNATEIYTCGTYCYYKYAAQIDVASSTNNGTTFNTSVAASNISMPGSPCCVYSWESMPFPTLAWGAKNHQLYLAYEGDQYGNYCSQGSYIYCYTNYPMLDVFFTNSSNSGVTWAPAHTLGDYLVNPNNGPMNSLYHPSMAVDSNGVIHLQAAFMNDSVCTLVVYTYGNYTDCGAHQEIYTTSTDNGTSWSSPVVVGAFWSVMGYWDDIEYAWDGTFTSTIAAGTQVLLAWTTQQCANLTTYGCYWGGNGVSADVMTSELFQGAGLTVTFQENGLPSGRTWSAAVMGNLRAAVAPATLSVSGVPPSQVVNWSVPWMNQGWGIQYRDAISPAPPASFTANSTVYANYSEFVKVTIESIPYFPTYEWQYYLNYQMSPLPGTYWDSVNTSTSVSVTSAAATYCYPCYNLSFVSWSGSGIGNVSTTAQNISFTAGGPVNETASFRYLGYCEQTYYPTTGLNCYNVTFPINFTESGLPAKTNWSVTWSLDNGALTTNTTAGNHIELNVTEGTVQYFVWTVPASGGKVWVPTTSVPSPFSLPQATIDITYVLENATSALFPVELQETGLPGGTPWAININGVSMGIRGNATTDTLAGGGPFVVNGSVVYLANGDGFYASHVTQTSYVQNATSVSQKVPGSLFLNGSAAITIQYSPMFLVTTTASTGGTVSPASAWVHSGAALTLNATASPGYYFVGWSSAGSGGTSITNENQSSPTINPTSPVQELATFRPIPAPTWNITVNGLGLPYGTSFSVLVGGSAFTGGSTFKVGWLASGNYSFSVPTVFLNSSDSTRFVPTHITTSYSMTGSGKLEVTSNGMVNITFTTQFLVTLASTPSEGGTISVAAGQYWTVAGNSIAVTATPAPHYYFAGWTGNGSGAVNQTGASVTITPSGPVRESAQFIWRPIGPPATYWVQVHQTGLPAGVTWNVSYGAFGSAGTGALLTVVGLNGTYSLQIAPIYVSAGTRWVANVTTGTMATVRSNTTLDVAFSEQFALSVTSSTGGNASPSLQWVPAHSSVTLTETPNATSEFVNWTGTGNGAYSGTSPNPMINLSGPVSEVALFVPIPHPPAKAAATTFGTTALFGLGGAIALLVVGLLVGLIAGRGRRRAPPPTEATYAAPEAGSDGPAPVESWAEAPPPGEEPPAS